MIQIVCAHCKQLVEVKDRLVAEHHKETEVCQGSGMRYVSIGGRGTRVAPGVDLLAYIPLWKGAVTPQGHPVQGLGVFSVNHKEAARVAANN